MSKQIEALKLALEALEYYADMTEEPSTASGAALIVREALADSALDRMAENARELGLDYEPPCKTGSQCTNKCQQCEQPAPVATPHKQREPVVWMYVNKSTHETKFQKHMRDFVDHSLWSEVPLYGEPLANHELQCVCGAVWLGDEMVHLPNKHPPASKPLTDAQIGAVAADIWGSVLIAPQSYQTFARAIEAAHGIKE